MATAGLFTMVFVYGYVCSGWGNGGFARGFQLIYPVSKWLGERAALFLVCHFFRDVRYKERSKAQVTSVRARVPFASKARRTSIIRRRTNFVLRRTCRFELT